MQSVSTLSYNRNNEALLDEGLTTGAELWYVDSSMKYGHLVQFFTRNFQIYKKGYLKTPKIFTHTHKSHQDHF